MLWLIFRVHFGDVEIAIGGKGGVRGLVESFFLGGGGEGGE